MPQALSYTCWAGEILLLTLWKKWVSYMRVPTTWTSFVATASCCFLQRSGLYIAVIVEVILKLIMDASSTQ